MKTDISLTKKQRQRLAFYSIVTVCLAVAGAASYVSTYRTVKDANTPEDITVPLEITMPSVDEQPKIPDEQVNEVKDDIPDTRYEPETEPQSAVATVTRAESFSLPLGNAVSKHASLAELVYSKTMEDWRVHNGIDFPGATGDPVKAVNNGIVLSVKDDALWGTVVEIDHGEGMVARYCGLGKGSTVNEGDTVKINDKVGNLSVIPIESADGVHLHFEVRINGAYADPIAALGKTPEDFN